MTFAFICPECGKRFEVSTSLAGKRGKCKQCGSLFRIPLADSSVAASGPGPDPYAFKKPAAPVQETSPDPYGFKKPAAPVPKPSYQASPPKPSRSSPVETTPRPAPAVERQVDTALKKAPAPAQGGVEDPYGLDEPVMPAYHADRASQNLDYDDEPAPPIPIKKKKRSVGFFGAKKSKPQSSSGGYNNGVLGLSFGGVVSVILIVLRLVLNHGDLFNLSGRSTLERFCEQELQTTDQITETLKAVHDVGTAHETAPKVVTLLQKHIEIIRNVKDKKALKTDIEAVKEKFRARQEASVQACVAQFRRIALIPGASDALRILEGPLNELAALEQEAKGGERGAPVHFGPRFGNQMPGFAGFAPPPIVVPSPPQMQPMPMPGPGPQFQHNMGRPSFPGPRFGPRMH